MTGSDRRRRALLERDSRDGDTRQTQSNVKDDALKGYALTVLG